VSVPDPTPADTYTHGHHASVLKSHTWRTVENSAAYLIPHLEPGRSLLDVGCGPGTITRDFAERLNPGRVLGIDVSAEIIDHAMADSASVAHPNLRFRVGDCYGLDLDDHRFDIVHAHQVLQHLSDPVAALREMRRVVKPDGVVAVRDADYHGMFWAPASDGLDRWMEVYQGVARRNHAEPDAGRHLVAWARAAGFGTITASADTWCFAGREDRQWWGGLWAERITRSSLAGQAVEYGIAAQDELEALGEAWRSWADHPDAWFAVVNAELLLRP
jgi:ubiquinone/menaquinone biosynthesis C-methylase UbiE